MQAIISSRNNPSLKRLQLLAVLGVTLAIAGCAFSPYRGVPAGAQRASLTVKSNLKKSNWNFLSPGHVNTYAIFDNPSCKENGTGGLLTTFQTAGAAPESFPVLAGKELYLWASSRTVNFTCINVVKFHPEANGKYEFIQDDSAVQCKIRGSSITTQNQLFHYEHIAVSDGCRKF